MMERLKSTLKNYFSNGPKAILIVMLILMGVTIGINAAKKTITVSIDGKEIKIVSFRSTFKDALQANDIAVGSKDKTTPSLDSKVKKEDRIYIKRAVNIQVAVDGNELSIQSAEDTVSKMFEAEGISVLDYDKVSTDLDSPLYEGLKIVVTRVESKLVKDNTPIDFATVIKNDEDSEKGVNKVLQDGQQGEKETTTRIIYENGKEVSREVIGEVVTKQPVQKIVSMGTLGSISPSRGQKVLYTKSIRVRATAYTADFNSTGKNPGDPGYEITASGTRVRRNVNGYSSVAVDPRVIPLGTRLYIEGYGYAIAEDTGGAIKGNTIDVFFHTNDEANHWGVRWVNIYILK